MWPTFAGFDTFATVLVALSTSGFLYIGLRLGGVALPQAVAASLVVPVAAALAARRRHGQEYWTYLAAWFLGLYVWSQIPRL
jgi:hypothetical protein